MVLFRIWTLVVMSSGGFVRAAVRGIEMSGESDAAAMLTMTLFSTIT